MDTKITQIGPVEYQLEITASADDLAPEIKKALKQQQARTTLKGFRPGKVPLPLVKKLVGREIAHGIVDKTVQQSYEEHVLEGGEHDVLGQPTITELDYDLDGDLRAIVQFGVRPEITVADLSSEEVPRLAHEVTDEELEEALENFLTEQADLVPVDDEAIAANDYVVFDVQEVDPATGTPIIGKRDTDQALFLDDDHVAGNPMLEALREALVGARAGETVRFQFEHDEPHGEFVVAPGEDAHHVHHFLAEVKEVKRRELPELDEEFVKEATGGRFEDVEAFRADFRQQLERMWERRSRELLEGELVRRAQAAHDFPVPPSVVEYMLDAFVEDVRRRNEGKLPPGFPEAEFRQANRDEAEQQARWMLLKEKIVEEKGLAVEDEDFEAFFEQEAANDDQVSAEQLQQLYRQIPQLMDQLGQRLLNQKVFDWLAEQVTFVETDWEDYKQQLEGQAEA